MLEILFCERRRTKDLPLNPDIRFWPIVMKKPMFATSLQMRNNKPNDYNAKYFRIRIENVDFSGFRDFSTQPALNSRSLDPGNFLSAAGLRERNFRLYGKVSGFAIRTKC